ncbi:LysE family translocator [Rhodocytophaga aerolata]|uniref:LysE family translocator n=1 Tax=Rhodocytophaga aerolata TaxID=455078 RepID=A0ABT8R5I6_9BACT|nr:LysE family translocator [Rhodocytophaga aerolata]MDO1445930.1 LysE family translocator [Rhodocytophaga aerolata]
MHALFKGILFGLLLAILIGPVFFALIQTSIRKGFRSGVLLSLGISLSDTLYILICYIGFTQLFEHEQFKESLAMIGGLIMFMFGISAILKPISSKADILIEPKKPGTFRYVFKGFALNAINPFVILFWVGVMSMVTVQEKLEGIHIFLFFLGTILTVFCTDISKAYVAHKLSKYLTQTFLIWMNRAVGMALVGFGCRLIYYAFEGL